MFKMRQERKHDKSVDFYKTNYFLKLLTKRQKDRFMFSSDFSLCRRAKNNK